MSQAREAFQTSFLVKRSNEWAVWSVDVAWPSLLCRSPDLVSSSEVPATWAPAMQSRIASSLLVFPGAAARRSPQARTPAEYGLVVVDYDRKMLLNFRSRGFIASWLMRGGDIGTNADRPGETAWLFGHIARGEVTASQDEFHAPQHQVPPSLSSRSSLATWTETQGMRGHVRFRWFPKGWSVEHDPILMTSSGPTLLLDRLGRLADAGGLTPEEALAWKAWLSISAAQCPPDKVLEGIAGIDRFQAARRSIRLSEAWDLPTDPAIGRSRF